MGKLSKAQRDTYNRVVSIVTDAQNKDYPTWLASDPYFRVPEWLANPLSGSYNPSAVEHIQQQLKNAVRDEYRKAFYDDARLGIVCVSCRNRRTVKKLQEYGFIEILDEGRGENRLWKVKLANIENS